MENPVAKEHGVTLNSFTVTAHGDLDPTKWGLVVVFGTLTTWKYRDPR